MGATGCTNNILIFPSWTSYFATIDLLDAMTESYCNNFDNSLPAGLTDAQYDLYATNAGFDEDNILIKFERDLDFCSLRRKLVTDEDYWLANQGNGVWDPNTDPDNDFIDDDTERALLSIGHEVIIGDKNSSFKIYKFFDDIGNYIEISNMDVVALQQINNGVPIRGNTNVFVATPPKPTSLGTTVCKDKVKEVAYEELNGDKLKRISKIRREVGRRNSTTRSVSTPIFNSRIKAKTKGYVKVNGRWKARRTWTTAGIGGMEANTPGTGFNTCETPIIINKVSIKRRRKVKVKETIDPFVGVLSNLQYFAVNRKKLFSLHTRGNLTVNKDFYEMPVN